MFQESGCKEGDMASSPTRVSPDTSDDKAKKVTEQDKDDSQDNQVSHSINKEGKDVEKGTGSSQFANRQTSNTDEFMCKEVSSTSDVPKDEEMPDKDRETATKNGEDIEADDGGEMPFKIVSVRSLADEHADGSISPYPEEDETTLTPLDGADKTGIITRRQLMYECVFCQWQNSLFDIMVAHLGDTHRVDYIFSCPYCPFGCHRHKITMLRHIRKAHPDKDPNVNLSLYDEERYIIRKTVDLNDSEKSVNSVIEVDKDKPAEASKTVDSDDDDLIFVSQKPGTKPKRIPHDHIYVRNAAGQIIKKCVMPGRFNRRPCICGKNHPHLHRQPNRPTGPIEVVDLDSPPRPSEAEPGAKDEDLDMDCENVVDENQKYDDTVTEEEGMVVQQQYQPEQESMDKEPTVNQISNESIRSTSPDKRLAEKTPEEMASQVSIEETPSQETPMEAPMTSVGMPTPIHIQPTPTIQALSQAGTGQIQSTPIQAVTQTATGQPIPLQIQTSECQAAMQPGTVLRVNIPLQSLPMEMPPQLRPFTLQQATSQLQSVIQQVPLHLQPFKQFQQRLPVQLQPQPPLQVQQQHPMQLQAQLPLQLQTQSPLHMQPQPRVLEQATPPLQRKAVQLEAPQDLSLPSPRAHEPTPPPAHEPPKHAAEHAMIPQPAHQHKSRERSPMSMPEPPHLIRMAHLPRSASASPIRPLTGEAELGPRMTSSPRPPGPFGHHGPSMRQAMTEGPMDIIRKPESRLRGPSPSHSPSMTSPAHSPVTTSPPQTEIFNRPTSIMGRFAPRGMSRLQNVRNQMARSSPTGSPNVASQIGLRREMPPLIRIPPPVTRVIPACGRMPPPLIPMSAVSMPSTQPRPAHSMAAASSAAATALATAAAAARVGSVPPIDKDDEDIDKEAFKVFNLTPRTRGPISGVQVRPGGPQQRPGPANLDRWQQFQSSRMGVPPQTNYMGSTPMFQAHNHPMVQMAGMASMGQGMPQYMMPRMPLSHGRMPASKPRLQSTRQNRPLRPSRGPSLSTYECPYCAYKTVEPDSLHNHILGHGASIDWTCPYCRSRLASKSTVAKHIEQVHPNMRVMYIPYGVPI